MTEQTFAIIKPDAVRNAYAGKILARVEAEGFRIAALRQLHMSRSQAEGFYAVHRERPFFASLTEFMSSGPCIVMALAKDDAIAGWRELMGATNPADARHGSLRKEFAESIEANAVHGSDSPESAATEIPYFFSALDLS